MPFPLRGALRLFLLVLAGLLASCGDDSSEAVAEDVAQTGDAGDAVGDATEPDARDPGDSGADVAPGDAGDGSGTSVPPSTTIGGDRPAQVVLPAAYDAERQWPLVLLLHGYGAGAGLQAAYWRLYDQVDERGFILLLPEGTTDSTGKQFWDAWPACCNFEDADVDDVAYLGSLLDEAESLYSVDTDRVYAVGHSNGGYMSYRLACDLGDRLAGIMSLAGAMPALTAMCDDNGQVAVLQVHGTEDAAVPYDTGATRTGAFDSAAFWASRNGCDGEPTDGARLDLVVGDEIETRTTVWSNCGSDVALWTLEGVGHIPAFNGSWSNEWLDWLLARSRR